MSINERNISHLKHGVLRSTTRRFIAFARYRPKAQPRGESRSPAPVLATVHGLKMSTSSLELQATPALSQPKRYGLASEHQEVNHEC